MASIKRKATSQENVRPMKKSKPAARKHLPVLPKEEPSFPRGGASVLTPLEKKQIQIQAKDDVLFEQSTGKKAARDEYEDEENDGDEPVEKEVSTKTKRKSKTKGASKAPDLQAEQKLVRIEGLSYKRLSPGTIVLGQVAQINQYDVALSLPNNLTGYVPMTSISDQLTTRVEDLMEKGEESDDDHSENDDLDLKRYFSIGQYLRAYVVTTEKPSVNGAKSKRHIELALKPRQSNQGLKKADLVINSTVQASVRSVEDHGLIMDLGMEDESVKGFMSTKEMGKGLSASSIQTGAVFLCLITGLSSNGAIIKLSADSEKAGNLKKGHFLTDAPTIDSFLPGTAVEILVSEITKTGIIGKAMGILDVTADIVHSGAAASSKDLEHKYSAGDKVKARIICSFPDAEPRKIGVSLLEHIISLKSHPNASTQLTTPLKALPVSTIIPEAKVVKVEPGLGLLLDMGVKHIRGYVHISRIADGKVEDLEPDIGPYRIGSVHKARVVGYNHMDGLYIVSMEPRIIAQPFLSIDDVQVGQTVKGTIDRLLVNEKGVSGLIVSLAEGITGLVPEIHFADIHLEHPERKFKEGAAVTARVLSKLPAKRQLRLTLKKALVNSDDDVWTSYDDLQIGAETPGAIVNITTSGAVVQFYGPVRGFLPAAEMSESYIHDPQTHFRVGQVVKVRIVSVNAAEGRMIVSCRDPSIFGAVQQEQLQSLTIGSAVTGTVSEKANDEIVLELQGSGLKAILPFEHLSDGSTAKASSAAKKIRVGQEMKELIVLDKAESKKLVQVTSKPSLVNAAASGKLLRAFEDVQEDAEIEGYVNNITPTGVFVRYGGALTGLLLKAQLLDDCASLPDFGMRRHQSISARVLSVDSNQQRFLLTQKPKAAVEIEKSTSKATHAKTPNSALTNPVDGESASIDDYTFGKLTKAKIDSVKGTQLNVRLADGVQGRVDISEVFDDFEAIDDRRQPLRSFRPQQVLPVRILGLHDSRNHKFLPISHRGKAPVFELSAKSSTQLSAELDILSMEKLQVGDTHLVFINNIAEDYVWVSLSPNVRGRIKVLNLSDNVSKLKDLAKNFPVGRALKAKIVNLDVAHDRLDLSARSDTVTKSLTLDDLSVGAIIPGRITKVNERQVVVQLSESLAGTVNLADLADDYSMADTTRFKKNQIERVCVRHIDAPNKRVFLSTRPSKVLSSSLPVNDREIRTIADLQVNDIIRGFVKNVSNNGLFISLGTTVTAFVRVADLSDLFLKDWKAEFEIDQLVEGKVIEVDETADQVRMSLKKSHVDADYKAPLTFKDMTVGQVVTGKIRKVADFGVFIVVDNSANVSGLCHRTQLASGRRPDPLKLYSEGDVVKAKVLKVDSTAKRISFGLKAELFKNEIDADVDDRDGASAVESDSDEIEGGAPVTGMLVEHSEDEVDLWDGIDGKQDAESESDSDDAGDGGTAVDGDAIQATDLQGLNAGGFDWTGGSSNTRSREPESETDTEALQPKKKKRRKAEIQIDRTGDLDAHGPQSVADFERLLLGQPNSSVLWLSYMAFQLQLSEIDKAREIGERALKTIHIREQDEKLNVWVALLNLENTYGSEESLDDTFKRACQYCDSLDIHERLISIYIQSGKHE
ncbi:MAG: hypothetical protein Q9183_002658, partial [Haloplaca sp. 2 TL-2023]